MMLLHFLMLTKAPIHIPQYRFRLPPIGWESSLHPGGLLHQLHDFRCETG
jgi:hypothetical protein